MSTYPEGRVQSSGDCPIAGLALTGEYGMVAMKRRRLLKSDIWLGYIVFLGGSMIESWRTGGTRRSVTSALPEKHLYGEVAY